MPEESKAEPNRQATLDDEGCRSDRTFPAYKVDVCVVGLGIGGLCAAIRAAELGAKVLAIDKLQYFADPAQIISELPGGPGNATLKAGGAAYWRGKAKGKLDYDEMLDLNPEGITCFEEKSWGRGNLEQYREIVRVGEYVFDQWLTGHGNMEGGRVNTGTMSPDGRAYRARWTQKWLVPAAERLGVTCLFKTKALKLLTDKNSKGVRGLRVLTAEGPLDITAPSVILATGGFEGNEAMKLAYLEPRPAAAYLPVTGGAANTGDGLVMAQKLGAQLINMNWHHTRMTEPNYHGKAPCGKTYREAIKVNILGERVTDESDYIATKGDIIIHQPGQLLYIIIDRKIYDERRVNYEANVKNTQLERPQHDVRREKMIVEAETIEELAIKCGINPTKLKKTIEEFNAAVRPDGTAPGIPHPKRKKAVKIDTSPFFASPASAGINQTLGGMKTNAQMQVLDTEEEVIPGLYAVGACANTHYGQYYYGAFGELDVKCSYIHGSRTAGAMGFLAAEAALGAGQ
ncbi:MAG: FAD-binding protein [Syntrophales bacterium LBB04]|nr:FAD-binding protein [Syntrophales bacterium LBB04]